MRKKVELPGFRDQKMTISFNYELEEEEDGVNFEQIISQWLHELE